VFPSKEEEGGVFFVFVSMVLRVEERGGEGGGIFSFFTKGVFVSKREEGGKIFCVCFKGFEDGRVDGRKGGWFFSLFTK